MRAMILVAMALTVITLAVYWQVGDHEFLSYDDGVYITENPHVASGITVPNIIWAFTSVHGSNWHPLTWLSHMADARIYGMNPRGHHLTNVVIHIISTLLLFLLLSRLTRSLWQSGFVAALFALHPLHVESVAWGAERKDLLCALFYFLALYLYAGYLVKRKPLLYLLTLFSFLLGLMSKPMIVTLPFVMLLMDFWPLCREIPKEKDPVQNRLRDRIASMLPLLKEKIPFFACSLLSAGVTIYAQHKGGGLRNFEAIPLGIRLENALVSYVEYAFKMFWPSDLAIFYPFPSSVPLWQAVSSLLILLLVTAAAVRARRRHPCLMAGWLWYVITLLPVIGLIQVGDQSMADRYTYIPLTGLFIMIAWGVPPLTANLPYRKGLLALLAGTAVSASTAATWQQLRYWQDNVSIFRHAVKVTAGNYLAHFNLGSILEKKGDLESAIREYREAIIISPDDIKAHSNLGSALARTGDFDAAIREYQAALTIKPDDVMAHCNLGNALARKGEIDEALKEYHLALKIKPDDFNTHYNLGTVLALNGDFDGAIREYGAALAINPDDINIHVNLGTALYRKGDLDAAIGEYRRALTINPECKTARNNLGVALDHKAGQEKFK